MRTLLLLLICCFTATFAHAQNPPPHTIQVQPGTSVEFKKGQYFIRPLNDSGIVLHGLSFPQSKKAGVYRLRQDNMPCLVPDTKDLVMMPNAFKGEVKVPFVPEKPQIPNPVQSYSYKAGLTK